MARTLILGGGFGGITVATELRRLVGKDHEIVLVDRSEHFTMGLRKLWAVVDAGTFEEGSRSRQQLTAQGVDFLHQEIDSIDPTHRSVTLGQRVLDGDYLVVALGAQSRPDLIPGLSEHAHNVWDPTGVPGLRAALAAIDHGRIAIVIAGVPYTCPPAPYECAMLVDDFLRQRGVRQQTNVSVTTLQPILLPNAGKKGSDWLAGQLESRQIEFQTGRKVERFEPGRIIFSDGELEADLIIAVPPHRVPAVVRASGLTGDGEWVRVDPATLATSYENVFAVGDVTQIKLANGLQLPKAGVIAELEGQRVAAAIAADLSGESPPPDFDGRGYCFLEMGKASATLIEGDFYAKPEPQVSLGEVSDEHAQEKRRFETERLARWFEG